MAVLNGSAGALRAFENSGQTITQFVNDTKNKNYLSSAKKVNTPTNTPTDTSGEKVNTGNTNDTYWKEFIDAFKMATQQADYANTLSKESTEEANKFNAEQAQINREFQKEMRQTEVQDRVKDMIKAGINPILGYNGGASTPSGSQASAQTYSGQQANLNSDIATIGYIVDLADKYFNGGNSGKIFANAKQVANDYLNAIKNQVEKFNKETTENTKKYAKNWKEGLNNFLAY